MKNLRKFRGEKGLSQWQLAEKVGVTRTLIVYLEKDTTHSTSHDTTLKICEVLDTNPCDLYGLDNLKYYPENKQQMKRLIDILKEEYEKWDL